MTSVALSAAEFEPGAEAEEGWKVVVDAGVVKAVPNGCCVMAVEGVLTGEAAAGEKVTIPNGFGLEGAGVEIRTGLLLGATDTGSATD